ncbi:conserved hypothetical protein [Vibrio chagasii]|nr:conserved hypothetical protein [Vibrio chagasii]
MEVHINIKSILIALASFIAGVVISVIIIKVDEVGTRLSMLVSIGGDIATIATGIVALIALNTWRKQHIHSEQWVKLEKLREAHEEYVSKRIGYWYAEEKRLMVQNGLELFPFKITITDEDEIKRICGADVSTAYNEMSAAKVSYERAFRVCSVLVDLPNDLELDNIDSRFQKLFLDFYSNFMEFEVAKGKRVQRKYYSEQKESIFTDGETMFVKLLSDLK